jgi:hypothetical protein
VGFRRCAAATFFQEAIMSIQATPGLGNAALEALILRAVVRKLVAKGVLTPDDVRGLLIESAEQLTTVVGNDLTVQEATSVVKGDLASFTGQSS